MKRNRTAFWLAAAIICAVTFLPMGSNVFAQEETEEVIELDTIVVTATKTEHTLGDVPVAVSVITAEEIKNKNIKTVLDALRYLTGIRVRRQSWGDHVEIQGLSSKYTLVLVDGQKIHGGGRDTIDLRQYPVEMIERIEVIEGPASALYGSDAIGGVINIITKSGKEKPEFTASAAFGSRETQVHEVSGGFKKGKLGNFLNYTRRESEGVHSEYTSRGKKQSDEYDEDIVQGNFQYEITPQSKLILNPYYSRNKEKSGVSATEMQDRIEERFSLCPAWEWTPDELSKLNLRGALFNYEYSITDGSSDIENDNYEVELNYSRLVMNRHVLTGGYHYQTEEVVDNGKSYEADQNLHSLFVQDEIDFSPFVFVLGTRIGKHDRWGTEVDPKVSLLYQASQDFKLKASVGKAFRAPDLLKLYADNWMMGSVYLMHANPNLEPEKSIGYQLGAEYGFSEKFSGELSFFRNELKDMISYYYVQTGPPPWDFYWENIDKVKTQGIELGFDSRLMKNLTAKLGYTFLDTENKTTGKELTGRPKHRLTLDVDYKIPGIGLSANLGCEYTGKRYEDEDNTEKLGGYTLFNLALTKDITGYAQAFVRVDNITGEKDIPDEYDIDGTEFLGGIRMTF